MLWYELLTNLYLSFHFILVISSRHTIYAYQITSKGFYNIIVNTNQ
uniref:Uncharacterized protein n=1 Tax=Arundo donax TaxID=35708 RepID=A0A0A9H4V1_ARUDO